MKIDVLAAIKDAAKALPRSYDVRPIHHALCDAGCAVSELIDADRELDAANASIRYNNPPGTVLSADDPKVLRLTRAESVRADILKRLAP